MKTIIYGSYIEIMNLLHICTHMKKNSFWNLVGLIYVVGLVVGPICSVNSSEILVSSLAPMISQRSRSHDGVV